MCPLWKAPIIIVIAIGFILFLLVNNKTCFSKTNRQIYALGTGNKGAKALQIQQKYMGKISYTQLQKAGLKSGMVVCDIGCGSGEMTEYLAQQVGKNGLVYAIDSSDEQLELTKKKIEKLGLTNVRYIKADIQNSEELPQILADIVYARLVLMHLPNPKKALINMYAFLKPGGILSLQETTWSTIRCSVPCPEMIKYRDAVIALGRTRDADYNLGEKLPAICKELGYYVIEHYTTPAKQSIAFAKELITARPELAQKIAQAGIATTQELKSWFEKILALPENDPHAFVNLADMTHVLVKKPNNTPQASF